MLKKLKKPLLLYFVLLNISEINCCSRRIVANEKSENEKLRKTAMTNRHRGKNVLPNKVIFSILRQLAIQNFIFIKVY